MNIFDFEKLLKKKVSQVDNSTDIEKLLADLNLAPKKSKRGFLLLFFIGFLLATSGYFLLMQDHHSNVTNDLEIINNSISDRSNNENTIAETANEKITSEKENLNKFIENSSNQKNLIARDSKLQAVKNSSANNSMTNINTDIFNNSPLNTTIENIISQNNLLDKKISLLNPINTLKYNQFYLKESNVTINNKIECPSFNETSWHFSIIPEIGYLYQIKNLNTNTTVLKEREIFSQRKDNEQSLEGLQAALYVRMEHSSGIYFKGGLSITRMTELMDFERQIERQDTTTGIISITESEDKDTLTVIYGDIVTTTTINQKVNKHYYIHQYDLPIGLGFSFDKRNYSIDFEAGIRINLATKYSGYIYGTNDEFLAVNNTPLFKKSLGIGFFGGIQFRKYLTGLGEFYISPRIQISPANYNSDINFIDQNYTSIGMHAGYILRF